MAAFHADERSDSAGAMDAFDIVGRESEFELVGIFCDEAVDGVDLFEDGLDSDGVGHLRWDVDGPELAADATGAKAWEIGYEAEGAGVLAQIDARNVDAFEGVAVLAEFPCEVVVAVDERDFFEDFADARELLWISHGSRRRLLGIGAKGQGEDGDQQQAHLGMLPVSGEVASLKFI